MIVTMTEAEYDAWKCKKQLDIAAQVLAGMQSSQSLEDGTREEMINDAMDLASDLIDNWERWGGADTAFPQPASG